MNYDREQMHRDIRFGILAIVTCLVILMLGQCAYSSECLHSARAVWAAHDGRHATWNNVDGQKCWRVGWGSHHHHSRAGARPTLASSTKPSASYGSATLGLNSGFDSRDGSQPVPLPRERPWKLMLFEAYFNEMIFGPSSVRSLPPASPQAGFETSDGDAAAARATPSAQGQR